MLPRAYAFSNSPRDAESRLSTPPGWILGLLSVRLGVHDRGGANLWGCGYLGEMGGRVPDAPGPKVAFYACATLPAIGEAVPAAEQLAP